MPAGLLRALAVEPVGHLHRVRATGGGHRHRARLRLLGLGLRLRRVRARVERHPQRGDVGAFRPFEPRSSTVSGPPSCFTTAVRQSAAFGPTAAAGSYA